MKRARNRVARTIVVAMLIAMCIFSCTIAAVAAGGICRIIGCGGYVYATVYQGQVMYTSTHMINQILFFFGGEPCTRVDYYDVYTDRCTSDHYVSQEYFSHTTHSLYHS